MMSSLRTFVLGSFSCRYTLARLARSRKLRLTVAPGGALSVTAPQQMSEASIEEYLQKASHWLEAAIKKAQKHPQSILACGGVREYAAYRDRARKLAEERLIFFNRQYGFVYGRVSIRNQKTRWGSCSERGNLSFNYRIALLPGKLADYVIVHELCHRGALDHSKYFWKLVERSMPDYQERGRELRERRGNR